MALATNIGVFWSKDTGKMTENISVIEISRRGNTGREKLPKHFFTSLFITIKLISNKLSVPCKPRNI
jgi:hypothetical protein